MATSNPKPTPKINHASITIALSCALNYSPIPEYLPYKPAHCHTNIASQHKVY
jgi:hypothetical protein